jgi:hypothetical protein|tara:strand:+ start:229 stop:408 length:180 start_codon:yes stop_codon:yes gene_type:complete
LLKAENTNRITNFQHFIFLAAFLCKRLKYKLEYRNPKQYQNSKQPEHALVDVRLLSFEH